MATDRELRLRLALEYEGAAYGRFISDTQSAQAAALGASGDLESLAVSLSAVGDAATSMAPLGQELEDATSGLSGLTEEASAAQAGLAAVGGGEASVELAAIGDAGEAASASLASVEAAATEAAGTTEQMSVAQAKAAVAAAQLAQADQRVVVAEREVIAALKQHGAGSAEAVAATNELVAAERQQVEAAEAVAKSTASAGQGLGEFSDKTKGIAAAVTGVVAALAVATNAAAEYNQAVTLISTLSTDTAARFDEYREGILSVSQALGQDAVAGARAAYDALSSGVPAENAIGFLEIAAKAATAGVTSIDSAGKALTVTMNSFNLAAGDVTDVSDAMFAAANVGVTTFDELAASFGGVASIAAASGAGYKETLAALAQITTKGAGTSEAVTQLKATFTSLSKPAESVTAALQEQGFASAEAAIKSKGLQFVLETVRQVSLDTNTPLIQLVGSTEAVNAVLATTGDNAAGAREKVEALGNSAGATSAAFDLISETPAQRMKVFESSVQAATISIGDVFLPILGGMLDAVTPLVQAFTSFTQDVLVPFGQGFNDLPEPIRLTVAAIALLVGGGAALITAYSVAQPMLLSLAPTLFGTAGAATAAGAASGAAAGGVGLLSSAASSLWATMGPLLPVLGAVVAVMSIISVSSNAAEEALAAQFETLDKGSASFSAYAIAAEKARLEGDSWVKSGNQWRDGMRDLTDDWLIAKEAVSGLGERVGGALSSAGEGISSFLGIGKDVKPVIDEFSSIEVSTGAILDAGQAFLEMGTNIDPAILASDDFRLAQARLNEQVRDGELDQHGYEDALLAAASAASVAAGSGAVLSNIQVQVRDSFLTSMMAFEDGTDVLSGSTLASDEFAQKQAELAEAVATGALSAEQGRKQWKDFIDVLAAGDTEAQKAISANRALSGGFEELKASLASGAISFDEANARVQALGADAGATGEQIGAMWGDLMGLAVPEGFAELGFAMSQVVGMDAEKMADALEEVRAEAQSSVAGIFNDQIQARREFQAEEAALLNERPQLIAEAEAKAAEAIAKAQAEGKGDRVAELQTALGEEVAAINVGNGEKLAALQAGYAAETQARRDAMAQALLDQTNSLLQLGKISADQAFRIFDSLKAASPDSHLFDEFGAATLKVSAAFSQATSANEATARAGAEALGAAVLDIEGTAQASVDAVEAREQEGIAAIQAHDAAITGSTELRTTAYQNQALAAEGAAGLETGADQARVDSVLSTDAVLQASTDQRLALRELETGASLASTDSVVADDARGAASAGLAAGVVETEHQRMVLARQDAAAASGQATDQMIGDSARLGSEVKGSAGVVDTSVRGIGQAYQSSGAAVRLGIDAIVTGTQAGNTALANLGTSVPANLAPAGASLEDLGKKAAVLGEDLDGVSQKRQSADKDAAGVATDAASETAEGFDLVKTQSVEAAAAVSDLQKILLDLPKEISIPFEVTGVEKAAVALAALRRDLKLATGVYSLEIQGTYKGLGAAADGGSLMLQHDVEDALAAAEPGLHIAGTYSGTGAAAWEGGRLALETALQSVSAAAGRLAPLDLLLFDPARDAADLAPLVAALAQAEAALADARAEALRAESVLPRALEGIGAALDSFFTIDPKAGGLAAILALLKDLGVVLDGDFFINAGILDAASVEDFRAQLASLADDPKQQEQLWKSFIDGLTSRWKVYYEQQSNLLERQRRALKASIDEAKAANEDADTSALDQQLEGVEAQLQILKDKNDDINLTLKEQTFQVGAQFDLYGRLSKAVDGRAKTEDDARRAQAAALKAIEDEIKRQQQSVVGAERDAHEQAMDLLDREVRRRDKAHSLEMKRLEARRKQLEADIAQQLADEEILHQARLAAITREVDAADAANSAEEAILSRARLLIDSIKSEVAITAADEDFLRSLGIDPEQVRKTNQGLEETVAQLDHIKVLLGKLPDEPGRIRAQGGGLFQESGRELRDAQGAAQKISQAERDALQAAIDAGKLNDRDRRIAEIFLAGGVVQSRRLREILASQVTEEENKVAEAEKQVDLADQLLSRREAELKLNQDNARIAREALEEKIRLEDEAFAAFKAEQELRLANLETERRIAEEVHRAWKDGISEAKDAEADRHSERMRQIQEEYALQLLMAGKTDAEIQDILARQAERAAAIAAEAQKRFEDILAAAEAANSRVTLPAPEPQPLPPGLRPGPPGIPIFPPPGGGTTDNFGGAGGGFDDITQAADIAGLEIADALMAPTIEKFDWLINRASLLGDIVGGLEIGPLIGGGDVAIDRGIHFHGPVTIDRELAEEIGLVDAARTGAP